MARCPSATRYVMERSSLAVMLHSDACRASDRVSRYVRVDAKPASTLASLSGVKPESPWRLRQGGPMKRMIAIVDLKSGEVSLRSSDTSTLDVPVDFDRDAGVASLLNARVHYASTG